MSVKTVNPVYTALKDYWKQCRDCFAGQKVVHEAGETYLPRLDKQTDAQYESYKTTTRFFNVFRQTVGMMVGLAFHKSPVITDTNDILENVTGDGVSISDYMKSAMQEILNVGTCGTFIDFPKAPEGITVAQAERLNLAPILSRYNAENIINWKYVTTNGVSVLNLVVLQETVDISTDEFEHDTETVYRVLDIKDGLYRMRLLDESGTQFDANIPEIYPVKNNSKMNYIPFRIHTVGLPPLNDLADTNIKHYQLKAWHNHGMKYAAIPTPYCFGVTEGNAPKTIGASEIWTGTSSDVKVGYLEFSGAGLKSIADELKETASDMTKLGARLLDDSVSTPTTATQATIDNQSRNSTLFDIVRDLQNDFDWIIAIMAEWAKAPDDTSAVLQNDFLPNKMEPAMMAAQIDSYLKGVITQETLFDNFKEGEIINAAEQFAEYIGKIDVEIPPMGGEGSSFDNNGDDQ